jgi:hypothetical protein
MAPQYKLSCLATFYMLLCMACAIRPEEAALLRWKSTLLDPTYLSSWSHDEWIGSWFGISCGHADHVTELELSWSNLNGTLDSLNFAEFQSLTVLDLSGNNLVGTIPSNISLLLTLTYLGVSAATAPTMPPTLRLANVNSRLPRRTDLRRGQRRSGRLRPFAAGRLLLDASNPQVWIKISTQHRPAAHRQAACNQDYSTSSPPRRRRRGYHAAVCVQELVVMLPAMTSLPCRCRRE